MHGLFVSCATGVEQALAHELTAKLNIKAKINPKQRGVAINFTKQEKSSHVLDTVYRINYGSRFSERVLLNLAQFKLQSTSDIASACKNTISWKPYFSKGNSTII